MLGVHEEEGPGETMKSLSELAKEIRARQEACSGDLEEPLAALAHDCWKQCADELDAWLREADKQVKGWRLIRIDDVDASKAIFRDLRKDFRGKILGTTQEGK